MLALQIQYSVSCKLVICQKILVWEDSSNCFSVNQLPKKAPKNTLRKVCLLWPVSSGTASLKSEGRLAGKYTAKNLCTEMNTWEE